MPNFDTAPIALPGAFEICRAITFHHGKTYALATRLMSPVQQRAVWALYAWARLIDDHVDIDNGSADVENTVTQLGEAFQLAVKSGEIPDVIAHTASNTAATKETLPFSTRAVLSAVAETYRDWGIDSQLEYDFRSAMLMDVPHSATHHPHFHTWAELDNYMWGSAAVIGVQMLPVIGVTSQHTQDEALPYAAELGRAFQITNFIRDIAEDFQRGRVYLPLQEWSAFGVDTDRLAWCAEHRQVDGPTRRALAYFIAYNRAVYASAEPGLAMLCSPAKQAISAANTLYSDILTEVEKAGYNVFANRAVVSRGRRIRVAALYAATAPSLGLGASLRGRGARAVHRLGDLAAFRRH